MVVRNLSPRAKRAASPPLNGLATAALGSFECRGLRAYLKSEPATPGARLYLGSSLALAATTRGARYLN